jgi:hypothetical protein
LNKFKINLFNYINNNLNKINLVIKLYNYGILYNKFKDENIYLNNQINVKHITKLLLVNNYNFNNAHFLNDANKTIIGLIFHENIIQSFSSVSFKDKVKIYYEILENFTFSDYIDRIIFQKQLWHLNEINYYIKILYNNFLLYKNNLLTTTNKFNDIIFTKILTKYSNEFNNITFINNIYMKLLIEKKDIFAFLYYIYTNNSVELYNKINTIYNINENDVTRLIKLI